MPTLDYGFPILLEEVASSVRWLAYIPTCRLVLQPYSPALGAWAGSLLLEVPMLLA